MWLLEYVAFGLFMLKNGYVLNNVFRIWRNVLCEDFHGTSAMPKKADKKEKPLVQEPKNSSDVSPPLGVDKSGNLSLAILAKPGAKENRITDVSADGVGVQINAPPVEGEANSELTKYIASVLGTRKSDIVLDKGSRSRQKTLLILDKTLSSQQIMEKLLKEVK